MASYFDIQGWFRKAWGSCPADRKQLLNLASIMAMQPKVLILDEPTSQLDPIAASDFLQTVYRINRDLGTTVIISEHRLEELFPMADRVMVMDQGRVLAFDSPERIGSFLSGREGGQKVSGGALSRHPMFYGLPSVTRIFADACPGRRQPSDHTGRASEAGAFIGGKRCAARICRGLGREDSGGDAFDREGFGRESCGSDAFDGEAFEREVFERESSGWGDRHSGQRPVVSI